jgi:Ca2+-transporting ATPase
VAWNQHAGRLTVQHASHRPSQSIDSDTLRPRSNSYASTADTILRPRGNSEVDPITAAKKYDDVPLTEALTPDPRSEADFQIDDNRFAFSPGQLNKMQNPKSLAAYYALGGLQGLEQGLRTDLTAGLSVDESRLDGTVTFQQVAPSLDSRRPSTSKSPPESSPASVGPVSTSDGIPYEDRVRVFSQNILPARQSTGFFKLFWIAYNDKIIILLTIAAIVSLSLGIYETLDGGHGVEWVEGVAICVAILIVTVVTAANDWQKERQFAKLNKRVSLSRAPGPYSS